MLTLHDSAAAIRTGNRFLEAFLIVDVGNACVRAFFFAMLAAVISVRAIFLEMFVKFFSRELLNFAAAFFGAGK